MTHSYNDPTHPIWNVAKAIVLFAFVFLFAWTNASEFDSTEITMLVQLAAVLFGGVALETLLTKAKAGKDKHDV